MFRKLIIGLAGLFLLASCSRSKFLKDEAIDLSIKSEIRKLDNQVVEGFAESNPQKIIALTSESFFQKGNRDIGSLVQDFGKKVDPGKFRILNQFYIKQPNRTNEGPGMEITTGNSGDHDYTLSFPLTSSEMFFSVGYFDDGLETWAFITAYEKVDNQWKLNNIQLGILRIVGKDAIDWYHQGKEYFKNGYLVDAVSSLTLSTRCMRPGNKFWHYHAENEIGSFRGPVQQTIDKLYTFPIQVTAVNPTPEIFKIFPQGYNDGYYPTIYYTTKLNFGDTLALSRECDKMHLGIGQLFKGLDINNKYIIYRAFEFVPSGAETVRSHRFVRSVPDSKASIKN